VAGQREIATIKSMKHDRLFLISIAALILCIASAVYADGIPATDLNGSPNWDNFGQSFLITILVTLPSFSIFLVTAIVAIIKAVRK